mgnify:CR=1 FL=1
MFSWNSLFDRRHKARGKQSKGGVSILVFLELALRPYGERMCEAFRALGFQSLFSWNSLFDIAIQCFVNGLLTRFNPCFPGTRSSTRPGCCRAPEKARFQSLFSWNSLFDRSACCMRHFFHAFQSLFSWNSLFDPECLGHCRGLKEVSILVFLELALRPFQFRPAGGMFRRVSILVFLELALRLVRVRARRSM